MKWTIEDHVLAWIAAAVLTITLSDSVAGFCARMAVAMPLCWLGLIDVDTAELIALPYGRK